VEGVAAGSFAVLLGCEVAVGELDVGLVRAGLVEVVDAGLVHVRLEVVDVGELGVDFVGAVDAEEPRAEEPSLFEAGPRVDVPQACSALQDWISAVPGLQGIQERQPGPWPLELPHSLAAPRLHHLQPRLRLDGR
jgi:hypothetical protein